MIMRTALYIPGDNVDCCVYVSGDNVTLLVYVPGDNVDCWMEIQDGKGPWASPVTGIVPIGSTLTMVVAINDPNGESTTIARKQIYCPCKIIRLFIQCSYNDAKTSSAVLLFRENICVIICHRLGSVLR